MMAGEERGDCVQQAKLAEHAERYEDMATFIKKVALMDVALEYDERNLLSVAYKNIIGAKRSAYRIISNMEIKKKDGAEIMKKVTKEYLAQIKEELTSQCKEVIALLDDHIIKFSKEPEALIFFKKMKGDYYRYIAECSADDERSEAVENSLVSYKAAQELSSKDLTAIHPIRLGLALNFSVFFYEIMNSPERACDLAKSAFDDAVSGLDSLHEDTYRDSSLIMQLLRDNLTLWSSDIEKESKPQEVDDIDVSLR